VVMLQRFKAKYGDHTISRHPFNRDNDGMWRR
jgi:hypothetical protein